MTTLYGSLQTTRLAFVLLALCALQLSACGRSTFAPPELGVACDSDEACGDTLVCQDGICVDPNNGTGGTSTTSTTGTTSTTTGDCSPGEVLCADDRTQLVCTAPGVWEEFPCRSGVCQGGQCVQPECFDGEWFCESERVLVSCENGRFLTTECGFNEVCGGNRCIPRGDDRADLMPFFQPFDEFVRQGEPIGFFIDVFNQGQGFSNETDCVIRASRPDRPPRPDDVILFDMFIPEIAPFESYFVEGFIPTDFLEGDRTYQIYAECDTLNLVDELDENNNTSDPFPVFIEAVEDRRADLAVEYVELIPNAAQPGEPVELLYVVSNPGEQAIGAFECSLSLENDGFFNDITFFTNPGRLAPGEATEMFTSFIFPDAGLPSGLYNAILTCFPSNQQDRNPENNTIQSFEFFEVIGGRDGPDLVIEFVEINQESYQEGEPVDAFGVVCNLGNTEVFGATIDLVAEIEPGFLPFIIGQASVDFVAPGECVDFGGFFGAAQCFDGFDFFFVSAEISDVFAPLPESNTNNNRFDFAGFIQVECGGLDERPDLTITRFTPNSLNYTSGETLSASYELCNFGEGFAEGASLRLNAEDNLTGFTVPLGFASSFGSLSPGECRNFNADFGPAPCIENLESFTFSLTIDEVFSDLPELNVSNNTRRFERPASIECNNDSPPDLTITEFDPTQDVYEDGDPVEGEFTVCNLGEGDATGALAEVFLSGPFGNLIFLDDPEIGPISAGTCRSFQASFGPMPCLDNGAYEMTLQIIDVFSEVTEENFDNNAFTSPSPVEVVCNADERPDLTVRNSRISQREFPAGVSLTFNSTIVNPSNVGVNQETAISIDLFDSNGGFVASLLQSSINPINANQSLSFNRVITFDADLPSGAYNVRITVDPENTLREFNENNNTQDITVRIIGGEPCGDDFDPEANERPGVDLEPGTYNDLSVCGRTRDFYTVCAGPNHTVTFTTRFEDDRGDIDIELSTIDGASLDRSISTSDIERVSAQNANPECYVLEVFLFGGGGGGSNTYELEVVVEEDPGGEPCDDIFDPQSDRFPGVDIEQGNYTDLRVCTESPDFYTVCAGPNHTIIATVFSDPDLGNIDLSLLDQNAQILAQSNTPDGFEELEFSAAEPTCYVLDVNLNSNDPDASNTYELEIFIDEEIIIDECDDAAEPNNSFDSAFPLDPTPEPQNFVLCPRGDVDIFEVFPLPGIPFTINIRPRDPDLSGAFALTVFDLDQNFIGQRFATEISFPVDADNDQPLLLRLVTSSEADAFPYEITLEPNF